MRTAIIGGGPGGLYFAALAMQLGAEAVFVGSGAPRGAALRSPSVQKRRSMRRLPRGIISSVRARDAGSALITRLGTAVLIPNVF